MSRKKLYLFILFLAFAGYSWIILNHYLLQANKSVVSVCLFRNVTGIPCPSCGTTHAVISIATGDFRKAFHENILGFPVAAMLLVFPLWILIDFLLKKESFYGFYKRTEMVVRKKWIAYLFLLILLAIWGWNLFRYFS